MNNILEVKNLCKSYGDFKLNNVSFSLPAGCIMGFVGENGAGKSTTLKAILDLIKLDAGEITVFGTDHKKLTKLQKEDIGVVFDECLVHEQFNIKNVDTVFSGIYTNWNTDTFFGYTKRFNLPEGKKVKDFSRGMKMKLSLSIALAHNPKLLILDEATSGLDPVVRDEILDIFLDFIQDEEHAVLISSHIISDLEKVADYITMIHRGSVIIQDTKDELLARYGVLHCSETDLQTLDRTHIKGVRKSSFGCEVLIDNRDTFRPAKDNMPIDPASLENIMLLTIKGGNF